MTFWYVLHDILNDFLKGEVLTELIFSPTPLVDTIGHDRVISKIYTLDSNGTIKPTQSNIRLFPRGAYKKARCRIMLDIINNKIPMLV